jgi:hypothetical protein
MNRKNMVHITVYGAKVSNPRTTSAKVPAKSSDKFTEQMDESNIFEGHIPHKERRNPWA